METSASFADQLADAARSMQGWSSTQLTLEKVVLVATEIIQGCDLVGISIVHSDGIDTPVGSDETLNRIDELQYWNYGGGPGRTIWSQLSDGAFAWKRWSETWGEFGWRLIPFDDSLLRVFDIPRVPGSSSSKSSSSTSALPPFDR